MIVPVVNLDTWQVVASKRLVIDADTGAALYVTDTASPQHDKQTQQAELKAARAALKANLKAQREAKNFGDFFAAYSNAFLKTTP